MIIICSSCSTRLQLDEAKIPARPFTIRCPKCQNIINGQAPAATANPTEQSALSVGDSPALENVRFKPPTAAPAYNPDALADEERVKRPEPTTAQASGPQEIARLLSELLRGEGAAGQSVVAAARQPSWERRRALVCVTPPRREAVARMLAESDYTVFVAEDTSQAIERMREDQMHIVILEPDFDPIEQGAAFVTREVNALRPSQRRKLLFVHLSATARTLDSHAAFVSNVNLVVNLADLEHLPHALERSTREYKELYRDFNAALNVASF